MSELSPVAQAVLDAFLCAPCDNKLSVAAALRAAADQVVPTSTNLRQAKIRHQLLGIAAELEGGQ